MRLSCSWFLCGVWVCAVLVGSTAAAQTPAANAPQTQSSAPQSPQPEPPRGKVLFQSHGDSSGVDDQTQNQPAAQEAQAPANAQPQLTDADRAAIQITRYDLNIRIVPASSRLTGRARLTVENGSDRTLDRIALQISSSLKWENVSLAGRALPVAQHLLDTDADHTGQSSELIVVLPQPLAPGASVTLDTFYSGTIEENGGRLERLGATTARALETDWDAIAPDATALRGFGNVLWFPVAAPQLFLSDGSLVPAIEKHRMQYADTPVSLRLSVEYSGEAPAAAYFCGRRRALVAHNDDADAPVAEGSGIATADFAAQAIGPRPLSLFVIALPETMIAPVPMAAAGLRSGATANGASSAPMLSPQRAGSPGTPMLSPQRASSPGTPMLAVESTDDRALPLLADSAERVAPLLVEWFGPHPTSALTVIDHMGQPFEDGPLLVAPVGMLAASSASPMLAHSLTHAWVQTGQPWMDEGLAEFFSLLWTEREKGRDAAVAQLDAMMQPVAAADTLAGNVASETATDAESSSSTAEATIGQPLISADDELFYRRKAAAVWWMLRDIVGEQPLQIALSTWRTQPVRHDSPEDQARAFEALLEKISGKDLGWFFNDWVLRDRGLPSLSIVDVTPREMPAVPGHGAGWLTAVTVHNAGAAEVEVPLVVRSGESSTTRRIHVAGNSNTTERVVTEAAPTQVVVNDGSVPEMGASAHTLDVVQHPE